MNTETYIVGLFICEVEIPRARNSVFVWELFISELFLVGEEFTFRTCGSRKRAPENKIVGPYLLLLKRERSTKGRLFNFLQQ